MKLAIVTGVWRRPEVFEIFARGIKELYQFKDIDFLINHHLRENEKIGLYWEVEGRYPFLDKKVATYKDVGKNLIKLTLLADFDESFIKRPKEGFRIDYNKNKQHQIDEYLKQLKIWRKTFNC